MFNTGGTAGVWGLYVEDDNLKRDDAPGTIRPRDLDSQTAINLNDLACDIGGFF